MQNTVVSKYVYLNAYVSTVIPSLAPKAEYSVPDPDPGGPAAVSAFAGPPIIPPDHPTGLA